MKITSLLVLGWTSNVLAAPPTQYVHEYTDTLPPGYESKLPTDYNKYQKELNASFKIDGGISENYRNTFTRIEVPGYISTVPASPLGEIVGPNNTDHGLIQVGDTIYLRWQGVKPPKEGETYEVFSPLVVLQNIDDPTDFIIRAQPKPNEDYPKGRRLSGYLYEKKGLIRIATASQGIVSAIVEKARANIAIGDRMMKPLPVYPKINPVTEGPQTSAVVVSGSPFDLLTNHDHSYIYINRGARDGMKVGQVLDAMENVKLTMKSEIKPETSLGEAMVVHVSDAFSTALITKQFDVIRVGALLQTRQQGKTPLPKKPFSSLATAAAATTPPETPPELAPVPAPEKEVEKESLATPEPASPADEKTPEEPKPVTPPPTTPAEPQKEEALFPPSVAPNAPLVPEVVEEPAPPPSATPKMSELDKIENDKNGKDLSLEEKHRLERLAAQEREKDIGAPIGDAGAKTDLDLGKKAAGAEGEEEESLQATNPFPANAGGQKEPTKKKRSRKKSNDEEELNRLMMQN